jgi:transcription antitermination factor NusG
VSTTSSASEGLAGDAAAPRDALAVAELGIERLPVPARRLAGGAWHVAHTKPRQEKLLAEALAGCGLACFLPLVRQVRFYGHRRRVVDLPLFPSYVFFHGDRGGMSSAVRTGRVVQVLAVPDQAGLEHELTQIDRALAGQGVLDPYPYLAVGRRVVVRAGPFMGLEGIVDERRSPGRLVLNVTLLGRSTSLEIDGSLLDRAD